MTLPSRRQRAEALIYIRRSYKRADAADVSDMTQEEVARSLLPPGLSIDVIRDSGGHQSGATGERDGYQRLLARIRSGGVRFLAVHDLSRLARNVTLMVNLRDELERRQVTLLAGNLPNTKRDSAAGRFMFNMLVSAAQFQRDLDAERMTAMMRTRFEDGRHRGNDPFGYRSRREAEGKLVRPRTLDIIPEEAEVVQRIWCDLATDSTSRIAARLNAEGVRRRVDRPWTRDAIKDVQRRGRFYLGLVVRGRGVEEAPGKHPPILSEAQYRAGIVGSAGRFREGIRPTRHRVYALRGLLWCGSCGGRLHGQTRASRGNEWSYYLCRHCDAQSVPAQAAEAVVLDSIRMLTLPRAAIERARTILLERLQVPQTGGIDIQRKRLTNRLINLRDLYGWGDMPEGEYRAKVAETRRLIAEMPDEDKVVLFDRHRKVVESMAENLDRATPEQRADLVRLLVHRAEAKDRALVATSIVWTPPVRPFFEDVGDVAERPRTDSNRRRRP